MFSRKRPVVQLTALLDLLFIMIFISLTSPMEPPPPPPPPTPPVSPPVEAQLDQVAEELARVEAENARYAAANDPLTTNEEPRENIGEYRKLFVANVHYKHGPTQYRYHETILYSADEHSGLYEFRVNLSGTRVIQTSGEPLLEADADRIKMLMQWLDYVRLFLAGVADEDIPRFGRQMLEANSNEPDVEANLSEYLGDLTECPLRFGLTGK